MVTFPALSEQELIDGLKTGNEQYFHYVFSRHWMRIMFFLGRFIEDKEARENVANRAFEDFWNSRKRFTTEIQIRNFLYNRALKISSKEFADSVSSLSSRNISNFITEADVVCAIYRIRSNNNTLS